MNKPQTPITQVSRKEPKKAQLRPALTVISTLRQPAKAEPQVPNSAQSKNYPPTKPTNLSQRTREYLTKVEVLAMVDAARKHGRYGKRDGLLILLAYRHGLRATELVNLQWQAVDFQSGRLHINRVKHGAASVQPMQGDELRGLRELQRSSDSPFVFASERGACLTPRGLHKIVARAGELAGITFSVHPHMLRHATGYALANAGTDTRAIQNYLGHKNIQHTVKYTALAAGRFDGFVKVL